MRPILSPHAKQIFSSVLLAVCAANASAQSTALTIVSEPGDFVGQGQTLSFDNVGAIKSIDDSLVSIFFDSPGHSGSLYLQAPSGQKLTPGVYEGAVRAFIMPSQPGLELTLDGRGCNTISGRFEVQEAVYGPYNYLERFRGHFEQHCEGATPALLGEIFVQNPPPPPVLAVNIVVDKKGSIDRIAGRATIGGSITCTVPTVVSLVGYYRQPVGQPWMRTGSFGDFLTCSPTTKQWAFTMEGYVPFLQPGAGLLDVQYTSEPDPNYSQHGPVYGTFQETVILTPRN